MTDYPYMISNNKIAAIITKIQQAARPTKFTQEVLKNLGFTSTNDRAFIPLLKCSCTVRKQATENKR